MINPSKVLRNSKINNNYLFNIKSSSVTIPPHATNIVYGVKKDRTIPTHESIEVRTTELTKILPIQETSDPTATDPERVKPSRSNEKVLLKAIAFPINPSDKNQIDGVYGTYNVKILSGRNYKPFAVAGNEGLFQVEAFLDAEGKVVENYEHPTCKVGDVVIPRVGNSGTWCDYKVVKANRLGDSALKDFVKLESGVDLSPEGTRGFGILEAATAAVNGCTAMAFTDLFQKNVHERLKLTSKTTYHKPNAFYCFANAGNSQVSKLFSQIVHSDYSYKNYKEKIGDRLKTVSIVRERETPEATASFIEKLKQETKTDMVITETDNQDKEKSKIFVKEFEGKKVDFLMAINSVGGASVTGIEKKLSPDSTIYTYGAMSLKGVAASTTSFIFKNVSYLGFWITGIFKKQAALKLTYFKDLAKLYDSNQLKLYGDDYHVIEWKPKHDSHEELLKKIQDGIQLKGKKPIVFVNHEE